MLFHQISVILITNAVICFTQPMYDDEDKRLQNSEIDKRGYSYVSEYKRLPVYNFGLGKRNSKNMYSFGLGKRYAEDFGKKALPQYSFGLGKRLGYYQFGLGKRQGRYYKFGLGKRLGTELDLIKRYNYLPIEYDEESYYSDIDDDKRGGYSDNQRSDVRKNILLVDGISDTDTDLEGNDISKRQTRNLHYGFGLGKRNADELPIKSIDQLSNSKDDRQVSKIGQQ